MWYLLERRSLISETLLHTAGSFPSEEHIVSTYRFVVAAIRVYFLKKMGFSEEQVFRMAIRNSGIREGLGTSPREF